MTIYFELEENPKGTAQMKGTSFQGGRIHHYEKKEVKGADIRGDIFGGGNQAEVDGDTHVEVGKEM